ncbi:hypothetical protein JCM8097_000464 [Rhodosporidiobolus ruineniae]
MPSLAKSAFFASAITVPLTAYLSSTRFVHNIPFHLNPPSFPASHVDFPWLPASVRPPLEDFTVTSSPTLKPADRLAYCEDAIPFSAPLGEGEQGRKRKLVLVSCDPNRKKWNTVLGPLADPYASNGALWVVDPAAEGEPKAQRVEMEWPALQKGEVQFHPLGVELVKLAEEGSGQLLLAVNHQANESTIEVFALSSSSSSSGSAFSAEHLKTPHHPSFTGAPNALAVLPSSSSTAGQTLRFFLSHDHHYTRRDPSLLGKLANLYETVTAQAYSRVDYVEVVLPPAAAEAAQIQVETVITGVAFANGLTLSPSGNTLVVASTTRRELRYYAVSAPFAHGSAPTLTLNRIAHVPFLVDNLSILPSSLSAPPADATSPKPESVEDTFTVLAAGHPSYPALLSAAHGLSLSLHLPSFLAPYFSWPGLSFSPSSQRSLSWAVSLPHPPVSASFSAASGVQSALPISAQDGAEDDWRTVFQSNGRTDEGGFGGSTTAIAGGERGRSWVVVAGLYEEGVKVLREKQ